MEKRSIRIFLGMIQFILLPSVYLIGDYLVHGEVTLQKEQIVFILICGFVAFLLTLFNLKLWTICFSVGFIVGTIRMHQILWTFTITHHPNMSGGFTFLGWFLAGFASGGTLQFLQFCLKKSEQS
jgi:hypothetical protein